MCDCCIFVNSITSGSVSDCAVPVKTLRHMARSSGLVLLLLGEKCSGKSSAGNLILGRAAFGSDTTHSSRATGFICGKQVTVVDTPGWRSFCPTSEEVSQELQRGMSLCGAPPDVVLLVLSVLAPFGPGQWAAMEAQLRGLYPPVWDRAMALFTQAHGASDGEWVQEQIRRGGGALQRGGRALWWLLERCGDRYHVLTLHHGTSHSELQQLMEKIQKTAFSSAPEQGHRPMGGHQGHRPMGGYQGHRPMGGHQDWGMLGTETWLMSSSTGTSWQQRPGHWRSATQGPRVLSSPRAAPLSFILLGRRKSGKSSVRRMILEHAHFKSDSRTSGGSSVGRGSVGGTSVTVVDTPGWSLFGLSSSDKVKREILHSTSFCLRGSRLLFLLVVPVHPFSERDRAATETYLGILGDDIWRNVLLLFTFGDELGRKTIEEHVRKQGPPLQWLMEKCGHRLHVIDTNKRREEQVLQLLLQAQKLTDTSLVTHTAL